jgi:hypothetical protein
MASFFVETFVSNGDRERFSIDVKAFRTTVAPREGSERPARHVRSYLIPRDELGVHVIEADSAEAVTRFARLAGVEVERIVTAIGDPTEGDPEVAAERARRRGAADRQKQDLGR